MSTVRGREPVVAGKVTHDQGYPLLGAKGNDMEDRNLGFKSFPINFNLILFLHLKSIICKVHEVTTRK